MKWKSLRSLGFLLLALFIGGEIYYICHKADILSDRITFRVAGNISSTQDLYVLGFGGQMPDKIEKLILDFVGYKEIDINEARKLIVYGVSKFIDEVNSTKGIRPYLADYPFTAKNIELKIWLYKDENYTYVSKDHILLVKNEDGIIKYYTGGSRDFIQRGPILVETYEEALAALGSEAIQVKEATPPS